jgi:hypothetical protein
MRIACCITKAIDTTATATATAAAAGGIFVKTQKLDI